METVFSLSNLLVMPFWAAMILLPGWRWTRRVAASAWIAAPAAALYAALVLPALGEVWRVVSRPEVHGVAGLLGTSEGAAVAWAHFLALDLFLGRWIYLDARERGVPGWVSGPILLLALMLAPVGLLLWLGVRAVDDRRAQPRSEARGEALRRGLGAAMAVDRPLALVAAAMVPLFLLSVAGVALDPTRVGGVPAWIKPMKFALSISLYSFTLLWMLAQVRGHRRAVRWVARLTAAAFAVEWAVIALQAWRGVPSHFNASTALDGALFSVMGTFVVVLWTMNLAAAVLLLRQRFADRALAWSLRLGLGMSLVGGMVATPMLLPTAEQRAAMAAGERVEAVGAHAVGVPDGGAGLPVAGWSARGGDLRVAHFVGLHGLQALPLIGLLVGRRRRLGEGHRVALVGVAGVAYLGLTLLLLWQALRGEPLTSPGPETLAGAAALAAATGAAVGLVLLHARSRPAAAPALARAA